MNLYHSQREKMLNVITSKVKNGFPVVIFQPKSLITEAHWKEITNGKSWWTIKDDFISARMDAERKFQKMFDPDWVYAELCETKYNRDKWKIKNIGNKVFLVDTDDCLLTNEIFTEGKDTQGKVIDSQVLKKVSLIENFEDADKYIRIISKKDLIENGRLDYAKEIVKEFRSKKFIVASISAPPIKVARFLGAQNMYSLMAVNSKLLEYMCERECQSKIEEVRAYADVGIDLIWISHLWDSSDLISIDHFKKYSFVYTKKIIDEIRKQKMKSLYRITGNARDRIKFVVESDTDCISIESGRKGFSNDIEWVNKIVAGGKCLLGNVNVEILRIGNKEELENEIRRQINIGKEYGKFIVSIGSPITSDVPLSRIKDFVEISRKYTQ